MWNFENDKPIYLQIVDRIIINILAGEYDEKLPSIRELANEINVNPNTVQKSYSELEKLNVIETKSTNGSFITKDSKLLRDLKNELAHKFTKDYLKKIAALNFSNNEIIKLIKKIGKEDSDGNNNVPESK